MEPIDRKALLKEALRRGLISRQQIAAEAGRRGLAVPDAQGMDPAFQRGLDQMVAEAPSKAAVRSGFRPRQEQARLYDGFVNKRPGFNPADPPDKSVHVKGIGADLMLPDRRPLASDPDTLRWYHENAARYGLKFPHPNEPWHVELDTEALKPMAAHEPAGGEGQEAREVPLLQRVAGTLAQFHPSSPLLLDNVKSLLSRIGRGTASGGVEGAAAIVEGAPVAATALSRTNPEGRQNPTSPGNLFFSAEDVQAERAARARDESELARVGTEALSGEGPTKALADHIRSVGPELSAEEQDDLVVKISKAVGSTAAFLPAAAAGPAGLALAGSAAGVQGTIEDARASGVTDAAEITQALRLGTLSGMSEAIPLERAVGRITNLVGPAAGEIIKGVFEEFGQEVGQQFLANVAARDFDADRELLEGVGEAGAMGGAAGGIINALLIAAGIPLRRGRNGRDQSQGVGTDTGGEGPVPRGSAGLGTEAGQADQAAQPADSPVDLPAPQLNPDERTSLEATARELTNDQLKAVLGFAEGERHAILRAEIENRVRQRAESQPVRAESTEDSDVSTDALETQTAQPDTSAPVEAAGSQAADSSAGDDTTADRLPAPEPGGDNDVDNELADVGLQRSEDGTITVPYIRNTEAAPPPGPDDRYLQLVEPAGQYFNFDERPQDSPSEGWERGVKTFRNPLIVDHGGTGEGGWKRHLSDRYDGKTGQKLSEAVAADGYDAILTVDVFRGNRVLSESVDLSRFAAQQHDGSATLPTPASLEGESGTPEQSLPPEPGAPTQTTEVTDVKPQSQQQPKSQEQSADGESVVQPVPEATEAEGEDAGVLELTRLRRADLRKAARKGGVDPTLSDQEMVEGLLGRSLPYVETDSEADYQRAVAETSVNPWEIVGLVDQVEKQLDENSGGTSTRSIAEYFLANPDVRLERESAGGEVMDNLSGARALGGRNRYVAGAGRRRGTDDNVKSLDDLAFEIGGIEPADVVAFIEAHPRGPRAYLKSQKEATLDLRARYEYLTGRRLTKRDIEEHRASLDALFGNDDADSFDWGFDDEPTSAQTTQDEGGSVSAPPGAAQAAQPGDGPAAATEDRAGSDAAGAEAEEEVGSREGSLGDPSSPDLFGGDTGTRGTSKTKQAIRRTVKDAENRVKALRDELSKAGGTARTRANTETTAGRITEKEAAAFVKRVEDPLKRQLERAEADLLRTMREGAKADAAVGRSEIDLFQGGTLGDPATGGAYAQSIRMADNPGMASSRHQAQMALTDSVFNKGRPIPAKDVVSAIADVVKAAGSTVPFRTGKMGAAGKRAHGFFKVQEEVIRLKVADDVVTASHELGHAVEKAVYGWISGTPFKNENGFTKEMRAELLRMGKALYGNTKPAGGYAREGWAEYFRYRLLTDKAASTAPRFHDWFETSFLKENPAVAKAMATARGKAQEWMSQGSVKRAKASIAGKQPLFERSKQLADAGRWELAKDKLLKNWVTEFQPLKKVADRAEVQLGRPLKTIENPFLTAEALAKTHTARVKTMVDDAMIDLAGNRVGPSLQEAAAIVRGKQDEFTLYLWARRALAMWHGRQIGLAAKPGEFDRGIPAEGKNIKDPRNPGISEADAEHIFSQYDSPDFRIAASKVYEWQQGVLNYSSAAFPGLAGKIKAGDVGDYIPLQRVFDDLSKSAQSVGAGKGRVLGRDPVKRLKGSGRRIRDPFEAMIENAGEMIRRTHERFVVNQIIAYKDMDGMGQFVEEIPRDKLPFTVSVDQVAKAMRDRGFEIEESTDEGLVTFFTDAYAPKGQDPVVAVPIGGRIRWFQLDEGLYSSLAGLDIFRLSPVLDLLFGVPTRLFRMGTTGLRASFALVTNPLRDFITLYAQSSTRSMPWTMAGAYFRSLGGSLQARAGGLAGTDEWTDAFYRMGLEMSLPIGQDVNQTRRAVRELFQGRAVKVADPRNWMDFLRDVLQVPETTARVTELRLKAKELGIDKPGAITVDQMLQLNLSAKRVTTDFASVGAMAKVVNQTVPFFTSGIGGARAFGRAFQQNPARATVAGMAMMAATVAYWWERKDEEWYRDLSARDRYMHWFLPIPNGPVIMIPRPHEWGVFFSAFPEAFLDAWYRSDPERVTEVIGHAVDMLNPVGLPVLIEEAGEQLANEDWFFERPIVPMREIRKPADEQFGPYTSGIAVEMGKIFGVSPRRIDHAIYGLLGGVGADMASSLDAVLSVAGVDVQERPARDTEAADTPIIGRLFRRGGTEGSRSKSIDEFYDRLEEAQTKRSSDRNPETEDERTVRLMLEDAQDALSIVYLMRNNIADKDQRSRLQVLARRIAKIATETADSGATSAADMRAQFARIAPVPPGGVTPEGKRQRAPKSASALLRELRSYDFQEAQKRFESGGTDQYQNPMPSPKKKIETMSERAFSDRRSPGLARQTN